MNDRNREPAARYPVNFAAGLDQGGNRRQAELIAGIMLNGRLGEEARIKIELTAELTLEEFRELAGPDENIVPYIAFYTYDDEGYRIALTAEEALESGIPTAQERALQTLAGLNHGMRMKSIGEISPETAMFLIALLDAGNGTMQYWTDDGLIRELADGRGITAEDLAERTE